MSNAPTPQSNAPVAHASVPGAPAAQAAAAAAAKATASAGTKKTASKATGAGTKAKKKPARRRKPASTGSGSSRAGGASTAQAILGAARTAQVDLARSAAAAAARRSDPLWYRTDEPVQSIAEGSFMASEKVGVLANQIELVETALARNHLTRADITPQAFACLLEQARRHALELLADAQDYAYSANRYDITRADLTIANEFRADQPLAVATQTPKLLVQAQHVNRIPLPPIPTHCYTGVVIPPEPYLLTARTFDVVSGAQVAQRMMVQKPQAPGKVGKRNGKGADGASSSSKPGYGASRGRQIPIKINQGEAASATGDNTTMAAAAATPAPAATNQGGPQAMDIDTAPTTDSAPANTIAASAPPTGNHTGGGITMQSTQGSTEAGAKRKVDDM